MTHTLRQRPATLLRPEATMYLGIDCGTQGTKALILSGEGVVKGRGYAAHRLIERETGAREQEPAWWVAALQTAVRAALAESGLPASAVVALAVSGQQHGLVVLDKDCAVLRPAKLWNDTETAPQNEELIRRLGGRDACVERFGILPLTGYTASKLLWLAEQEPETFARIRHILLPHEYLNFWLTGELRAEYGDASGTAFFDPRTRTWTPEVLSAIDGGTGQLAACLPTLAGPETMVGTLRAEAADALGLTTRCLVAAGGGDNMMGAIGTGNVREGVVTISLGTSSTVYSFSRQPVVDPSGQVAPFCSSSGGWLPLVCTMNATNVVTQTLEVLGRTVSAIEPALGATQPGAGGLSMLPFLNGERTPDLPHARGTLLGLSAINFTAENLIRAAVEGVSFGILAGLARILEGREASRIVAIGGGARSAAWRQLLSDATGAEVVVPVEAEAGCLGAAMQARFAASHAAGTAESFDQLADSLVAFDPTRALTPRPALRQAYDDAYRRYRQALATQYGVA